MKQWLWNHQGDHSFDAGGVCTIAIGFVEGYSTSTVPDTEINRSLGVVGAGYVVRWGVQIDHDFSKRSEISLVAGVSSDVSASEPEKSVAMEYFKFAGNGMKLDDKIYPDAETPILGRWADGKLHDEPMELGYDLTILTTGYDLRKPLKYFFVIDYEFDAYGIETKAELPAGGVKIENKGGKTIVSVIVGGESFNAPRNVMAESNVLTWINLLLWVTCFRVIVFMPVEPLSLRSTEARNNMICLP